MKKASQSSPESLPQQARALREKGDFLGAVQVYEKACARAPGNKNLVMELAETCFYYAKKMADERRWDEAKAAYRRTLQLDPTNVATLNNLAEILQHQNERPAARALYGQAMKLMPDNLLLHYNRSICYLTEKRLEEGWADFTISEPHWRRIQDNRTPLPWHNVPLWDGAADLRDKKVLVWGEQGIGDEIVYASLLPDLIQRGAVLTVECTDRLVPLFARSFSGLRFLSRQPQPLPGAEYDYQVPWLWLARCVRPTMQSFPSRPSFLLADAEKTARFRQRYQAFGKKRIIGLSWFTGSPVWGLHRSIPLPDMLSPLPLADTLIIDMQYGNTADAWRQGQAMFPDLAIFHDPEVDQFKDMDVFAAQVAACDAVVTISNTTSHVAGALGVPAAILMPQAGLTWYWFDSGEDCPWYPSLRLLRPEMPNRLDVAAAMVRSINP